MWNGRVLLGRNPVFTGDRFSASYFETDFASFLAWRDWGFPDQDVFNGFGMGALRCADGAFVLGEMGQHTAECRAHLFSLGHARSRRHQGRRGRHIPAASRASSRRRPASRPATIEATRIGTASTPARGRDDPDPARRYAGRSLARAGSRPISPCSDQPELSAIHLVRGTRDLTAAMPRFVTAFIEAQFASQP